MKSIGTVLKEARLNKKITLQALEFKTKIKQSFLKSIEAEQWDKLPAYPVVLGFVRSIAQEVGVEMPFALALLRRDYPPTSTKSIKVTPAPDLENKVIWSPRRTFLLGVTAFLVIIIGYLGFQYYKFISPPELIVNTPTEDQQFIVNKIKVAGSTDTDAKVEVNNQPLIVDQDGNFEGEVEVNQTTEKLVIKSTSRSGKETVVERKIKLDL